jgi:5-oxoprolinase (ATP-hydrolysing)
MQSDGSLRIDRAKKPVEQNLQRQHEDKFDPVLREVLAQRIAAIADQMGIVLEQTATSVNVKQRRDFSCAVFDARGELIANAPHVPVHLGAMGRTVQAMIERFPRMHPGDSFVTNDPYQGGSHLPDVTLVTPVFDKNGSDRPAFFVASRAHHAEIGGIAPGSMAPTATRLGQEGVILPPMHWTEQGVDRPERVEALLLSAQYPTRNVAENMADLLAQQAANQRGVLAMQALAESLGVEYLQTMLESILDVAKAKTVRWIDSLPKAEYRFEDAMDDRTQIAVRITKQQVTEQQGGIGAVPSGARLVVDFEGTGLESIGNLNANPGIVTAAVMYTIRCAIGDSMPLNSGVMRAVELKIPPGILNPRGKGPKEHWPAVAGGNVETSQRIVDVLWGALGLAAASQGTMNNFLFGNSHFGYYETIGGGTGASQFGPGAHAVHSHMTNTRLTDVEVLESRYPVRVISFGVRRSSGGKGHYEGGSGMVREVMALEPLEVSLVTSRRGDAGPYGLQEGESGLPGENWWIGTGDQQRRLEGSCQLRLKAGERIRIMTPGGGGFGSVQLR